MIDYGTFYTYKSTIKAIPRLRYDLNSFTLKIWDIQHQLSYEIKNSFFKKDNNFQNNINNGIKPFLDIWGKKFLFDLFKGSRRLSP